MNLIALLGGGKGKGADPKGKAPMPEPDDSADRTYAKEAFSAIKDDDEAGFVDAFTSAVKACMKGYKDAEPDTGDSAEG